MAGWWDYDEPPPVPEKEEDRLSWLQKFCTHEWKFTTLIISTVGDCKRCGVRKEDFDAWEKGKK